MTGSVGHSKPNDATANPSSSVDLQSLLNEPQAKNIVNSVVQNGMVLSSPHTAPACRSICIDACYRTPERLKPDLELAKLALAMDPVVEGPLTAAWHAEGGQSRGQLAKYTQQTIPRSAPLTLATALMPSFFPQASVFGFFAALLPGIAHVLFDQQIYRHGLPHLTEWLQPHHHNIDMEATVDAMMQQVQLSQHIGAAGSGVTDLPLEQLEAILKYSLGHQEKQDK